MQTSEKLDLLSTYQKINSSFKKKLVYKFDYNENFYSEFNNMVLTMLYCLEHEIQFSLYSQDGIFSIQNASGGGTTYASYNASIFAYWTGTATTSQGSDHRAYAMWRGRTMTNIQMMVTWQDAGMPVYCVPQ